MLATEHLYIDPSDVTQFRLVMRFDPNPLVRSPRKYGQILMTRW